MHGLFAALDYVQIVKGASWLELGVLILLAGASAMSWGLIALKSSQLSRARAQSVKFLDAFWKGTRLEAIYQSAKGLKGSPLSKVFCAGYEELTRIAQASKDAKEGAMSERLGGIENVERALHRASTSEITELESRIPFLGTVGATAPFVGLLGTTMGIVNAFQGMAAGGSSSLASIGSGVSEALITTAFGLLVAIPAVWAYNYFQTKIDNITAEMTYSSKEMIDYLIKGVSGEFGRSRFTREFNTAATNAGKSAV